MEVRKTGYGAGGMAGRAALTVIGAAGLIIGALMNWVSNVKGTKVPDKAMWSTNVQSASGFLGSIGFIMIVLGLLALVGLVMSSGWLTRIAGILGVVGVVLFLITVYRVPNANPTPQIGVWICLAGGLIAVIGGFLGKRVTKVTTAPATTAPTTTTGTTTTGTTGTAPPAPPPEP